MKKILTPLISIILAIVVTLLWGLNRKDDWNTAVLLGTAIIIAWYTIETYTLRLEAQKSRDLSLTPELYIFMDNSSIPLLHLKNAGNLIVYDLEFTPFELQDDIYIFRTTEDSHYLAPGQQSNLSMISINKNNSGTSSHGDSKMFFDKLQHTSQIPLIIQYKNSTGDSFYILYKLYKEAPLFPKIQFVATNKGNLTYTKAKKLINERATLLHPSISLNRFFDSIK